MPSPANSPRTTYTSDTEQLLISAPEVAKILGISARSVWRLHSAGKLISPIRLGGAVRWRRDEILRWIAEGCPLVTTSSEERK